MTVTRKQAEDSAQHGIAGAPVGISTTQFANQAGRRLMTMRQWRWHAAQFQELDFTLGLPFTLGGGPSFEKPSVGDVILGQTSGATATISSFRQYTGPAHTGQSWLSGTAVGKFELVNESGTFAAESLTNQTTTTANIAAIAGPSAVSEYVTLPANLQGVIAVATTPDQTNWFEFTSPGELLRRRGWSPTNSGPPHFGFVVWTQDPEGTLPNPRIDMWPPPQGAQVGALNTYLRISWLDFLEDPSGNETDAAVLPPWLDDLYLLMCRNISRGYEDDLESPNKVDEYLSQLRMGETWRAAVRVDSQMQPLMSPPMNGMIGGPYGAWSPIGAVTGP